MLKHITFFLLILVLAGSLSGCSSEEAKRQQLNDAKYEQNRADEYRAFFISRVK